MGFHGVYRSPEFSIRQEARLELELVKLISFQFTALFAAGMFVDIVFLSSEQEADIARVCSPFYPPAT